jgi:formate hydrogenlyase subunit 3/multisubunit Na+/H+ antiporter MnhD subunit
MNDAAIPCAGTLGIFLIVFGFIVAMRYLRYRETLSLAEKGLVKPERTIGNGKDTLRWGIALTAVGVALFIGLYPIGFWADPGGQLPLHFGPWLLAGLLPMFFGLGLVLIYVLTREPNPPSESKGAGDEQEPPPAG